MSAEKAPTSLCSKIGLKPINLHNILFFYAPLQGSLAYTALSVNVMNPNLVLRLFPRRDITNVLLGHTVLGAGLFLYSRPHMEGLKNHERILYSAFGAGTFSLGSVLLWAILRSLVPQNVALCTLCGLGSGLALMKIGYHYSAHVDTLVVKKD